MALINTLDLKVNLSANEAYGTAGSSRKTDETEICTNNINAPTVLVEDQHVYEHVHDVVKGTMMETHANQAYEPVNIGKE